MNFMPISTVFAGAFVIYGLGIGADVLSPGPEERVLTLAKLDYDPETDIWTQQVVSESGKAVTGNWSVQISRLKNGALTVLCEGSGQGIYVGAIDKYRTNDWVGANCPELAPNDIAEVAWEYVNHHGVKTSLSATIVRP